MAININHANHAITTSTGTSMTLANNNLTKFKNRIINGNMFIHQQSTAATTSYTIAVPSTVPAPSPYASYAIDRWFIVPTGAAVTTTLATITGGIPNTYAQQITGAASVSSIAFGQRIEQLNSWDLAGGKATLSFWMANSLLTSVTWKISYANTADAFGTFAGTGASSTTTQISTGSISTLQAALQQYNITVDIPAAATTGIEILFTVGAQTSGTWSIANVQFEKGAFMSDFEVRTAEREQQLCARYAEPSTKFAISGYNATAGATNYGYFFFKTKKRIAPSTATMMFGTSYSSSNVTSYGWGSATIDGARINIVNTSAGMWVLISTILSFVSVEL